MRTSDKRLQTSLNKQIVGMFVQTIIDLKNPKDAQVFFNDFFTDSEIETFSKRLAIAYWLKKGRSYANIKNNLKVSSATIASVQNLLDKDGILVALKNIEADEWAHIWAGKIKKIVRK
ncbi:hypothetical protein C4564_05030 [Candidatus Microgenomates bacterium]|nr:MAG: hypothetical protein C4564_05030 [Candidatus Microgenomates bacterium]